MKEKKVSIILPCYNAEKWVKEAVESALNQTYENTEVIAVDNESTDSTMGILEDIQKTSSKLIISSAKNIYPYCWDEAREEGLSLSSGEYLTTLCSDDFFEKDYIKSCVKILNSLGHKVSLIQSPIMGINEDCKKTGKISHTYKDIKEFKTIASTEKCPVTSPTVFYKRELYDEGLIKTDPEKYSGAADYDLYCNLADRGLYILPVPHWIGYNYRWHSEQATWNMHNNKIDYNSLIQGKWRDKWTT